MNFFGNFLRFFILNELAIIFAGSAIIREQQKIVEDENYWTIQGRNQLNKHLKALSSSELKNLKAKNIILFIGDGMGMTSITTGRIYKGQLNNQSGEDSSLVFDNFPNIGLAKTYNVDKQVPDSAGTATAILTGIKTNYRVIGMDSTTTPTNSNQGSLSSIMDWAQAAGKFTGIVTTTRITHATPAASYARIFHRDWECDSKIPLLSRPHFKDIAAQLVDDNPGRKFNVIFGGGLRPMGHFDKNEITTIKFEGDAENVCGRNDSRDLVNDWLQLKATEKHKGRFFVQTRDELMSLNVSATSNVLGLFRNNHLTYGIARERGEPTISEMTQQAIRILSQLSEESKGRSGFILLIEGGRIDQGHHQNYARAALHELVEMDSAVEVALNMTKKSETLIIVTADHSHALAFNGYPKRGQDILGFANKENISPYETLSYTNGPGFRKHRLGLNTTMRFGEPSVDQIFNTWIPVELLSTEERVKPTYMHLATFPLKDETHGGEDVPVFATGPGSQLLRGVFEQNYLGWAMSYAGCIGPAQYLNEKCDSCSGNGSGNIQSDYKSRNLPVFVISFVILFFLRY